MFLPEGYYFETEENQEAIRSVSGLKDAMIRGSILEARAVLCDSSHNLWVDLPCAKGMIPREEGALGIDDGSVRDIALISRVNRPVCFTVQTVTVDTNGQPLAILSRKAAQKQCREAYLETLIPGDIIRARVTHLEPFGAFCDIGCGISSLISIDSISVSRIFHPSDRFSVGDDIKAIVKDIRPDGKISLTHKELLGTWEENAALFGPGETVSGIVRTVESYGSFVELTPNLAGLAEPKEGVEPGQQASVFIKSMIPEKMKVKLIIVDAFHEAYPPAPSSYFITASHIDDWQYSPPDCEKKITTIFGA